MRPLSAYIEYLLMTQHYAFLPGLGGFVLAEHEAALRKGMILAPSRTVQFNRFMTHDDGLLANIIMEDTGMNYDEVMQRIRHEVASMLNQVQHSGRCQLGHLGQLFSDEECHIAFRPADTQRIDPLHYGHENLTIRPWQQIEAENKAVSTPIVAMETRHKSDVIEVPRYWFHRAAIILLIVCFFFGNLMTGSDNATRNYAKMFNPESLIGQFSTLESQSWDENWESEEYAEPTAEVLAEVPVETPIAKVPAVEMPAVADSQPVATAASTSKLYYIIIASTTDQEEAQRVLKRFAKKGYENIGIIERDGRLRLYIDNFAVKSDAEARLREVRQIDIFEKAWLLPVKCTVANESVLSLIDWTPLQLIIKEKDNDHLSMELSHLNPTAERDQG